VVNSSSVNGINRVPRVQRKEFAIIFYRPYHQGDLNNK